MANGDSVLTLDSLEFRTVTGDSNTAGQQTWRYYEHGSGPAVVFVHGFPDTPHSWLDAANVAAEAGFRAIVPYLRGYHPDTMVPGRGYTSDDLGADVLGLLDALDISSAVLVGHDWGAGGVYAAYEAAPERVSGLVPIAIAHPAALKPSPKLLFEVRHFFGMKAPFANARVGRNDFAYIDTLYRRWAPDWSGSARAESISRVKDHFADDAVLDAAIQHYRDLDLQPAAPANGPLRIGVPALLVAGLNDFAPEAFEASKQYFDAAVDVLMLEAGHWPHREQSEAFHLELADFLRRL